MNRRNLLVSASALALLPSFALAGDTVRYTDGVIQKALADGKTVFVDYATDWCSTCAAQERMIESIRSENPAYDANMLFVRVDFDKYGTAPVSRDRRIPRRSTLIVLKGEEELGRLVAVSSRRKIKELMDAGLEAATS